MRNLTFDDNKMDVDTVRFEDMKLILDDDGSFRIVSVQTSKKNRGE
jgi:hypothetical protein